MHVIHQRPKNHRRYEVKGLAYSPDGRYLLAGVERRIRDVWDLSREGRLLRLDLFRPDDEPPEFGDQGFLDVAWTPDGTGIVAMNGRRVFALDREFENVRRHELFHAESLAMPPATHANTSACWVARSRYGDGGLFRLPLDPAAKFSPTTEHRDRRFTMQSITLQPGRDLAAIGGYGEVLLARMDPFTSIETGRLKNPGWIRNPVFSPDGRTLAATAGWRVLLWNVAERDPAAIVELKGHSLDVTGLAFTPDGRWLLSTSLDETVRLWNPATGEPHASYDWGLKALRSVACATDGMTAAVGGSGRKSIAVFDLE